MNSEILNRDFKHPEDGWYQIEVTGSHFNRGANLVQIIDSRAVEQMATTFNREADQYKEEHGIDYPGMLIDREHWKHDLDKETRAYGWLMRLCNRDGKLMGQIRWTKTGREAIDGGDYRFFSTEYDPRAMEIIENKAPVRARPIRLAGLTLTNDPNNKGGLPITNREEEFRQGPGGSLAGSKQQNQRTQMKSVASKLGLSAEASEETILAEVTKVMNRATEAEGKVTPLTNRVQELETANATLTTEQIEADFAAAGIKDDKIVNRHKPLLSDPKHFKNRQERLDFINDLAKPGAAAGNQQRQLRNRDGKAPAAGAEADTQVADRAVATKIQNRACELQKQMPNLSLATAYRMAQGENAS